MADLLNYSDFLGLSSVFSQGRIQCVGENISVKCTKAVKNAKGNAVRDFQNTHIFTNREKDFSVIGNHSQELLTGIAIMESSPSGSKQICIRCDKESAFLADIRYCGDNPILLTIDLAEKHGKVMATKSWFGGCGWSDDERYFCYVAQTIEKKPKTQEENAKLANADREKFEYIEDWGETYVGVSQLGIFVIDFQNAKVIEIPMEQPRNIPSSLGGLNARDWDGVDDADLGCPGQPSFACIPRVGGSLAYHIVYTRWMIKPRRLGMVYCYQRPCNIYAVDVSKVLEDGAAEVSHRLLSTNTALARSARVMSTCMRSELLTESHRCLVFIGRSQSLESHNGCFQLFKVPILENAPDAPFGCPFLLVDIVDNPFPYSSENHSSGVICEMASEYPIKFPGIFCDQLPFNCFGLYNGHPHVFLTTQWGMRDRAVGIDLKSGNITELELGLSTSTSWKISMNILDVCCVSNKCFVLFTSTSFSSPACLNLCEVTTENKVISCSRGGFASVRTDKLPIKEGTIEEARDTVESLVQGIQSLFMVFGKGDIHYEAVLLLPKAADADNDEANFISIAKDLSANDITDHHDITDHPSKRPLLVVPHGGPHSAFVSSYLAPYSYLCATLGYGVLLVNYRGSTGYGDKSINSLLGNIGRNDVDDLMCSLRFACSWCDYSRVGIVGGSHGGFLAAHAIGQYPEVFKVSCMRNPVTNIPAMVGVTDIPDWCFVESKGLQSYDFNGSPYANAHDLVVMYEKSPIQYLNRVRSHTLICLGAKDRRVPFSQGIEYYHSLRASYQKLNTEAKEQKYLTKLLVFPEDTHAIDKPTSDYEHWGAIQLWFKDLLK